jgi:hypothetical protein
MNLRETIKRILKEVEEQKVLHIPSLSVFGGDFNQLQNFLELKGNPPYTIGGDLDLRKTPIKTIGNLMSVGGNLSLRYLPIKSLGNLQSVGGNLDLNYTPIQSLGNLQSVGGSLDLIETPIDSLWNLTSVGGDLTLWDTPLSEEYTEKEIRQMVDIGGNINM